MQTNPGIKGQAPFQVRRSNWLSPLASVWAMPCLLVVGCFVWMQAMAVSQAMAQSPDLPQEGLQAWYRGDGLELIRDRVKGWKNQVANAETRDLVKSTGQPTAWFVQVQDDTQNETQGEVRAVVRFDGNSSLWAPVAEWGSLAEERTLFFVVRVKNSAEGYLFDGSTSAGMCRAYVADGKWHAGVQSGPIANASKPRLPTSKVTYGKWEVHGFSFQPTAAGATEVTHFSPAGAIKMVTSTKTPLGGLILGNSVTTKNGLACDLAEAIVYRRVLADEEAKQVTEKLNARWKDAVDLASQPIVEAESAPNDPRIKRVVVRREGDDNCKSYRIPGLAVTSKGTLIAAFDIRWNGSGDLPADIDVGVMRSTDNGDTWGPLIVAIDYDKNVPGSRGNGVGDAAILVDQKTGHVFLAALWSKGNNGWNGSKAGMSPEETGQLVIARSTDDGLTWEAPKTITPQIKQREWRLCFNGPGAGIQLQDGTLVFPAQFRDASGKSSSCFIFSTDHGENWKISPPAIPDNPPTSESQVVQLADGSLLMTMRNESRFHKRLWSRWEWSGKLEDGKWVDTRADVIDPVCMAGLTMHPQGYVLLSNNNSDRRERMTIRYSTNGKLWSAGKLLDPRPSAYSCLAVLPNGEIGILYECGDHSVQTITFARFPLAWVTEK